MASILDKIFATKREEVERQKQRVSLATLESEAAKSSPPRDFAAALRRAGSRAAIIAEIKRASPSKGDMLPDLAPAVVAKDYQSAGASAISVLTDLHFKGSLDDLRKARSAVALPILRKDFIFDPYQIVEARCAGADCILLIAAMLTQVQLSELYACAGEMQLGALIEVHSAREIEIARRAGAQLLGINNRDLHTFVTDIAVTEKLLADYPGDELIVSESGIDSPDDIRRLHKAGARAFLIGESLLRGGQPLRKLNQLVNALCPA